MIGSILVTGATGKTGRAVVRRLLTDGAAVRVLVRPGSTVGASRELGEVERVEGDLCDPGSLVAAARGVEAIYHICPNVHPAEVAIGRAVISAATATGVRRFVFHSVLHPGCEAMPHHWRKLRVEELLLGSGLGFTILRPAAYMQNLLGQWESIVVDGVYRVPYGLESRIAMVDLEDVAEAAIEILTSDRHVGAAYELCAADDLSQTEVASLLGRRLGRPVLPEVVSLETWSEQAMASGLDRERIETLLAMFRFYDRFGMRGNPNVLGWLLARPPTSFDQFVERTISGAGSGRGPVVPPPA